MKPLFTPEDFKPVTWYADEVANLANAKLAKLIESWPEVYAVERTDGMKEWWQNFPPAKPVYRALLAFIEELPKEPCKHEALVTVKTKHIKSSDSPLFRTEYSQAVCRHCGVELMAEWKEKK